MKRKNYKEGLAALLEPTSPATMKQAAVADAPAAEPEEGLYVKIPESLKKRFDVYCAENRLRKHAAVADAIRKMMG